VWDWNLDGACTDYGGCSFTRVCKSSDPETWLPVYFAPKVWDPLARKELTVQEYEASWGYSREAEVPAGASPPAVAATPEDALAMNDSFRALLSNLG
jgi:hypothetical protein